MLVGVAIENEDKIGRSLWTRTRRDVLAELHRCADLKTSQQGNFVETVDRPDPACAGHHTTEKSTDLPTKFGDDLALPTDMPA